MRQASFDTHSDESSESERKSSFARSDGGLHRSFFDSHFWAGLAIGTVLTFFVLAVIGYWGIAHVAQNVTNGISLPSTERGSLIDEIKNESSGTWKQYDIILGSGAKATQAFVSPKGQTRIQWRAQDISGLGGVFSVEAKESVNDYAGSLVANSMIPANREVKETTFLRGKTVFYLDINATCPWGIIVEVLE